MRRRIGRLCRKECIPILNNCGAIMIHDFPQLRTCAQMSASHYAQSISTGFDLRQSKCPSSHYTENFGRDAAVLMVTKALAGSQGRIDAKWRD
jgi:hypothetical protein